jgi:hypothetical protein
MQQKRCSGKDPAERSLRKDLTEKMQLERCNRKNSVEKMQ